MWQRFSETSRRAILLAQESAQKRGGTDVGVGHFLLGVLAQPECDAVLFLRACGVLPEALHDAAASKVPRGDVADSEPRLTSQAKRALEWSADEARRMHHQQILTTHLLLAIARNREDEAVKVLWSALQEQGIDLVALRKRAREHLKSVVEEALVAQDSNTVSLRFNEAARRAILQAQEQARLSGSARVEPHHLLLALLEDGPQQSGAEHASEEQASGVSQVLEKMGVAAQRIELEIASRLAANAAPQSTLDAEIRLSPDTKRVLGLAAEEAQLLKQSIVRPEHLLLGLLRSSSPRHGPWQRAWQWLGLPFAARQVTAPRLVAAQVLAESGIELQTARVVIRDHLGVPLEAGDGLERFTESARRALRHAHELCWPTGCGRIHPAHLLLGLLHDEGSLSLLLTHFEDENFAPERIDALKREVRARIVSDGETGTAQMRFAPATQRILKRASKIATGNLYRYIGPEYLIVALLENKSDAALEPLRALMAGKTFSDDNQSTLDAAVMSLNGTASHDIAPDELARPLNLACFYSTGAFWLAAWGLSQINYLTIRGVIETGIGLTFSIAPLAGGVVSMLTLWFSRSKQWKAAANSQISGLMLTTVLAVFLYLMLQR